jgi:hypothetical protein
MTTQVIFKIDRKLKDLAMKKAQQEGIAFASILKLATSAYVSGSLAVQLAPQSTLNAKTRRELMAISEDIRDGKNFSPSRRFFSSFAQ